MLAGAAGRLSSHPSPPRPQACRSRRWGCSVSWGRRRTVLSPLPSPSPGVPEPPVGVQCELGPQEGCVLVTWLPVTIRVSSGTSNGLPVTGYAVYADGQKVTELNSPTGQLNSPTDHTELNSPTGQLNSPTGHTELNSPTGQLNSPIGHTELNSHTGQLNSPIGHTELNSPTGQLNSPIGHTELNSHTGQLNSPTGHTELNSPTGQLNSPIGHTEVNSHTGQLNSPTCDSVGTYLLVHRAQLAHSRPY